MEVKLDLHFDELAKSAKDAVDVGLVDCVTKIEQFATDLVPQKTSALMSSAFTRKVAEHQYRFGYNKEYAAYQERGERLDGSNKVQNYSKAGTGSHFLERAATKVGEKAAEIIAYHVSKAKGVK